MIYQYELTLPEYPKGYHLITKEVMNAVRNLPEKGVIHVFIQHTSAGLTINENADPSVRSDFETFMNDLIPEEYPHFVHTYEGTDDMPAHLKSSLIGSSVTIPVVNHRPGLGTWQGIYLCEFRNHGGPRSLVITVYS